MLRHIPISQAPTLWAAFLLTMGLALLLTIQLLPAVHADGPPLGDCFNGALSDDPMNCYILEQAQEEEVIDVEAMYNAVGVVLYVYLDVTEPLEEDDVKFFRNRAEEFLIDWPELAIQEAHEEYYDRCLQRMGLQVIVPNEVGAYGQCVLNIMRWERNELPYSPVYKRIEFREEGSEAWEGGIARASLRKVWPDEEVAGAASPSAYGSSGFDVSDVDMTNLLAYECPEPVNRTDEHVCNFGRADIAESLLYSYFEGDTLYVFVKDPPEDEMMLDAVKQVMAPCRERGAPCTITCYLSGNCVTSYPGDLSYPDAPVIATSTPPYLTITNPSATHTVEYPAIGVKGVGKPYLIEIIPSKYSHVDLHQWAAVLDRFARSRGNTVGILGADVWDNTGTNFGRLWTSHGPGKATRRDDTSFYESTIRPTILVYAYDAQTVLDALPALLPALGIPLEAVGAVEEVVEEPGYGYPDSPPADHCTGESFGTDYSLRECLGSHVIPPSPIREFEYLRELTEVPGWIFYSVLGTVILGIMIVLAFMIYKALFGLVRFVRRGRVRPRLP